MMRLSLAVLLTVSLLLPAISAASSEIRLEPGPTADGGVVTLPPVALRESGLARASSVAAPPRDARSAQTAAFVVTYDAGFQANPAARAAFQHAVDIWSSQLTSNVPIAVDASFEALGPGVLGSAGATYHLKGANGDLYPAALANTLAGFDHYPTTSDIQAQFSSRADWYYGTDGATPATQSDFVSVVLHELGHGLGFAGSGDVAAGLGYYGLGAVLSPIVVDRFVQTGGGQTVLSFPIGVGSTSLAAMFTGDDLYWSGPNALAANAGQRPRLYAPSQWVDGSSYSHLDEAVYGAGDANSLMTPAINRGEAIHDPGPIARAIFQDIGWTTVGQGEPTAISTPAVATATAVPTGGASMHRVFLPFVSRDRG